MEKMTRVYSVYKGTIASSVEKLWCSSGVPVKNCGSKKKLQEDLELLL